MPVQIPNQEPLPNDTVVGDPPEYWLSQRDNELHPSVTCFPTSVAMVCTYLLSLLVKTKADIGIKDEDKQIEDYITENASSSAIKNWMLRVLGNSFKGYAQRAWVVAKVEEKIFDDMFRRFNYDAILVENSTFDEICDMIDETNMPMVISGDYRKTSTVQGHITCVVGYNKENRELIINDPYGYAYDGYKTKEGARRRYKFDDFYNRGKKNGEPTTWVVKFVQHDFSKRA
jgi:hypothetical protein